MKAAQFWRINANMVLAKISSVPNNIVVKMNVAFKKKDFRFLYTWKNCPRPLKVNESFHMIMTKPWKLYPTVRSICIEATKTQTIELKYIFIYHLQSF